MTEAPLAALGGAPRPSPEGPAGRAAPRPVPGERRVVVPRRFAFEEIGWIAADLTAIALRRGIAAEAIARGVVLRDAHLDTPHLFRLASHPRLLAPAETLAGGAVRIATTLVCLDAPVPALLHDPATVLASLHLDTLAAHHDRQADGAGRCSRDPFGRFGTLTVSRSDAPRIAEPVGRGLHVIFVGRDAAPRWPGALVPVAVGDGDLWPPSPCAFG